MSAPKQRKEPDFGSVPRFSVTPNRPKNRYHAKNERMDAMYRFHQEKRIKPGLAITQRHIRLCDRHLRAAGVSSRNEFVEKAIECYAGWLDVKQNPEFFSRFDAHDFSGWQV